MVNVSTELKRIRHDNADGDKHRVADAAVGDLHHREKRAAPDDVPAAVKQVQHGGEQHNEQNRLQAFEILARAARRNRAARRTSAATISSMPSKFEATKRKTIKTNVRAILTRGSIRWISEWPGIYWPSVMSRIMARASFPQQGPKLFDRAVDGQHRMHGVSLFLQGQQNARNLRNAQAHALKFPAACENMLRAVEHHGFSLVHDKNAVGAAGNVFHAVRNKQHGVAALFAVSGNLVEQHVAPLRVEPRGRLVQDQHVRLHGDDACNGGAALLPAGKLKRAFAEQFFRQTDKFCGAPRALLALLRGSAPCFPGRSRYPSERSLQKADAPGTGTPCRPESGRRGFSSARPRYPSRSAAQFPRWGAAGRSMSGSAWIFPNRCGR